jgi:hypothetical protein
MLSKDFVYEQLFNLSKDESDEQRVKIINDLKDKYRYEQISMEGNDPAVQKEKVDVEEELKTIKTELTKQRSNLKDKGGRPREGNTYKKDKHPYGRDPIGDGERTKPRKRELHSEKRNARDMVRQYINGISSKRKVINEKKTFMDDENIINE